MVATVAVGAVVAFFVTDSASERPAADSVVPTSAAIPVTSAPPTTLPPNELVEVDRVWLIDRGDGVFDWGVSVGTPADAAKRSGVVIDVRLIDADDDVVEAAAGEVNGIGPDSLGAVAGRLTDADRVPVRLEFDIAIGVPANDLALADILSVRGLERDADAVSGRIRLDGIASIDDVTMVLLWFDDAGEVVAAVPQPVEQVRADVDARFDIDLGDEVVPEGRPDAVIWTR